MVSGSQLPKPLAILRQSVLVVALCLVGCASAARLPVSAGTGAHPNLPAPDKALIPLVHVVDAKGWPAGATPVPAEGTAVAAFAPGLQHPRWLYVLPNGDVLVAESNGPERPQDGKGIKGWFFHHFQTKAGGTVPSPNRITLLRDADGDGVAETRTVFLSGLYSPFGMALVGNTLYVADSDALLRFPYKEGETRITAAWASRSSTCRPGRSIITGPRTVIKLRPTARRALRRGGLEQQRDGERRGGRGGARGDLGGGPGDRPPSRLRLRAAQPGRHGLGTRERRAVGGGQRTRRARQRPGARLHDGGPRRRVLRLALQLLRPAPRPAGQAAAPGPGRQGRGPRLRPRAAHRLAGARLVGGDHAPREIQPRHVRRPARLLEPQAAERLQSDLRPLYRRRASPESRSTC